MMNKRRHGAEEQAFQNLERKLFYFVLIFELFVRLPSPVGDDVQPYRTKKLCLVSSSTLLQDRALAIFLQKNKTC